MLKDIHTIVIKLFILCCFYIRNHAIKKKKKVQFIFISIYTYFEIIWKIKTN